MNDFFVTYYYIVLRDMMHKASWNEKVYITKCQITASVVDNFTKDVTYCPECFEV